MPSTAPLHSVRQFVSAFHSGIQGQRLETEDSHSGSGYDLIAGPSAIFFRRLEQRDRDLFHEKYNDTADGQALSDREFALTGIARILDSYGTGSVILQRANANAGAGTFWGGDRILAQGSAFGSSYYAVVAPSTGIACGASQTQITVPIRATKYGPGTAIDSSYGAASAVYVDPLWDNSWKIKSIVCADGTLFEKSKDYLARVRAAQLNNRVGFTSYMTQVCQKAGCSIVEIFGSNYANNDYGVSAVYVADASFNGTSNIVTAATLALENVRVLGADLLVGPMVPVVLRVQVTAKLTQDPSTVDTLSLQTSLQNALSNQFSSSNGGFAFSANGLVGVLQKTSSLIQNASILDLTTGNPLADATVMIGNPPIFPQSLNRYSMPQQNISFIFTS